MRRNLDTTKLVEVWMVVMVKGIGEKLFDGVPTELSWGKLMECITSKSVETPVGRGSKLGEGTCLANLYQPLDQQVDILASLPWRLGALHCNKNQGNLLGRQIGADADRNARIAPYLKLYALGAHLPACCFCHGAVFSDT